MLVGYMTMGGKSVEMRGTRGGKMRGGEELRESPADAKNVSRCYKRTLVGGLALVASVIVWGCGEAECAPVHVFLCSALMWPGLWGYS